MMSDLLVPTYVFEGDMIKALHEGSVIASGTNLEEVEQTALEYLENLGKERKKASLENAKKTATSVITPNGVEATILGRTSDLWGEEQVTIRTANGTFATVSIHSSEADKWQWINTDGHKTASMTKIERLSSVLDETYNKSSEELKVRATELQNVAAEASQLIAAGVSLADAERLEEIKLAANAERHEIGEVLAYLEAEEIEPYEMPRYAAVEQVSMGRAAADSWLDRTLDEMINETDGQDLAQVLREGPALFVSDLDTGALADMGVTRDMALSHVRSKTAGYVGEDVKDFHDRFIARVEVERRAEYARRKEESKNQVLAKQEELIEAPDEALFF